MSSNEIFPVPASWKGRAWIDEAAYRREYERSVRDPEGFWAEHAARLDWFRKPTRVRDVSYGPEEVHIRWFDDGTLNASSTASTGTCRRGPSSPRSCGKATTRPTAARSAMRELYAEVCRLANGLRSLGVRKGDRVTIYLPMVPEVAAAMLACARIGAIHSVVFAGFSSESLAGRIRDCDSRILITADEGLRGGRRVPLKANADEALKHCPSVSTCIVLRRTGGTDRLGRRAGTSGTTSSCRISRRNARPSRWAPEDPLFILYTSGSTGRPKGVLHATGGYLLAVSLTHQYVLDYHEGDVFWCTADVGWVTGHSYIVYGPLANGATTVMFEGVPNYPDASRFWQIVDKHRVSIFYTAPTAIRALIREGEAPVKKTSRKSLRLLGSVGEPINPEAWLWYYNVVGERRCPIVDTWWQTETGAILIAPLPGAIATKPGSATVPFFGVQPVIVDEQGRVLEGECEGRLCLRDGGPGMMRTVYRDHDRFVQTYFSDLPRPLLHRRRRAARQGRLLLDYRPRRRCDQCSGHRLGTAEVESALVAHPRWPKRRSLAIPHAVKGQGIYAYVTLRSDRSRATSCEASSGSGCARRSARSPRPITSSGRRVCPRPARARSCGGSCARLPRTTIRTWATPRRWRIRRSSTG